MDDHETRFHAGDAWLARVKKLEGQLKELNGRVVDVTGPLRHQSGIFESTGLR